MLHSQTDQVKMGYQYAPSTVQVQPPYNVSGLEEDPPYRPCLSYYPQVPLGNNPGVIPPPSVGATATGGLVLALNPNQSHPHQQSVQQQSEMRRPWWLWIIAAIDIVLAVIFAVELTYDLVTRGKAILVGDPIAIMWLLFIFFASFTIHFTMGLGLLAGLNSPDHSSALWYCQAWSYGAYFHFGELALRLLLMLFSSKREISLVEFVTFSCRVAFRIVSFILVRRYMYDISLKEQERGAAERRFFQLCQQQQEQHQPQEPLQLGAAASYPHRSSLHRA